MSNTPNINKEKQRGNELFCEAAETLLEDIDKVALDISPEEADELQEIFNKISESDKESIFKYAANNNEENSIAAEKSEEYKKPTNELKFI